MKATAKDLRFHSKELLETVKRGEEVTVTFRGKPCAKLVPFENENDTDIDEGNDLFGIWYDNDAVSDVDATVRAMRQSRF